MIENLQDRRTRLLGSNVPTFYRQPLHIVRGEGVWLWDADGKRYLDAYNNVAHVGHCNSRVVEAICRQAAKLNTHTRYIHENVLDYIERICATFDGHVSQGMLVCTASEANDVALRMAQAVTGKTGVIATSATYHGNTTATAALSTRRPPIGGRPPHVRLVEPPKLSASDNASSADARRFASDIERAIGELETEGFGFSALVLCPFFANEGFPPVPRGYLDPAVQAIRKSGGLIISDEVQVGFGRLGSDFWGHQRLGFRPDIVTAGKSMANGHPVAGLFTTPDIMNGFRSAFGYFNTYGGNPVSAAAASATLDVLEREGLQKRALDTGDYLLKRLQDLRHPLLVDVRGSGLYAGVEFRDRHGAAATAFAERVVEGLLSHGVLVNRIGPEMNVIKIRPPMPFANEHVELLIEAMEFVLADLAQNSQSDLSDE